MLFIFAIPPIDPVLSKCDVMGPGAHLCQCGATVCKGWMSALQKEILLNAEMLAINQDITPQGTPVINGNIDLWVFERDSVYYSPAL